MDNNTIVNATQPIDDPEIENGIPPGAVGRLGRPYGGGVGKRHDEQSWFALAPDGQLVATGHRDGAARLWDLATGKVTHILRHAVRSSQMFMKVAFALDGERIATTLQTSVCVWTRGGTKLLTLEVEATDIAFAQDGRLIAFTRELIRAFDVDGRESWRWQTPTQTQLAAIHPDGETCVALDRDGTGLLRQIGSVRPIKIAASGLQSIAFGPDRKLVVAADEPWLSAWKLSAEAVMRCELPPESERPNSVALAPDGQHYAVSARTESAIVDMNTGVRRALRSGQRGRSLDQLTWAAGGRVIGGWNDAQLQLWDSATGLDLRTRTGPGGRVNAAASSEDGQVIATARASDDTHEVELWHAEQPDAPRARLPVGDKAVLEIALSRDGRTLVVTTTASALQYWDTQSATRRHTEDIAGGITAPTFCRDGTLVAIANQAVVQLRDPASGALVTTVATASNRITALAFSHDDSWLAVGDSDGMILVYRVKTRELRVTLRRHTSSVTFLAFTGAQLFSGDSEGTVRIWDLATWRHVRAVAKDTGNQRLFFNTLARAVLSGDGRRIAVPVNDRIRIVELGEGTTRTTDLDARQGIHVSALYLFGGDSRLLSAGADGTLVIWPMPPPVLPPPIYAPPPLAAPNPARRFELHDNKSAKFWEVTLDGDAQIVTFGKIGTAGQTQLKEFASDAKARAAYDKLVAQKLGEGYVEVVGGAREAAKPDTRAPAVAERFSDHTKVEVVAGRQVRECSLPAVLKLLDTANAWTRKLGFRVACVPGFDLSAPGSLPGDIPIDVVIGLRVASVSADDGPSGPIDGATLRTGLAHCKELPAAFWDEVADVVSKIFDSVEDTRSLRWHSDDALHLVSTGPLSAGALVFGSVQTRAVAERKFMPFESGTDMRHRPHKKVIAGVRIAAVQMEAPAICTLRLDEEAERGYRDEAAAVPAPHAYHLVARYD